MDENDERLVRIIESCSERAAKELNQQDCHLINCITVSGKSYAYEVVKTAVAEGILQFIQQRLWEGK